VLYPEFHQGAKTIPPITLLPYFPMPPFPSRSLTLGIEPPMEGFGNTITIYGNLETF